MAFIERMSNLDPPDLTFRMLDLDLELLALSEDAETEDGDPISGADGVVVG
jgi:hypothetical protein